MFWPFTNCSSDLKIFENSRPLASKIKIFFSRSLEHFFLTVGQNHFGSKIPFPHQKKVNLAWSSKAFMYKETYVIPPWERILSNCLTHQLNSGQTTVTKEFFGQGHFTMEPKPFQRGNMLFINNNFKKFYSFINRLNEIF